MEGRVGRARGGITKENGENCGADGYAHYLVCSVGFVGVKDVKTYQNVQCKHVQFTVCQSYFKIMLCFFLKASIKADIYHVCGLANSTVYMT